MTTRSEALSKADFERLRSLIYEESGINLTLEKKTMLEIRLRRRLQVLELPSLAEYSKHVFSARGKPELGPLIDAITTNKTDFFREAAHFNYLTGKALPE